MSLWERQYVNTIFNKRKMVIEVHVIPGEGNLDTTNLFPCDPISSLVFLGIQAFGWGVRL